MIKNAKQATITKEKLEKAKREKTEWLKADNTNLDEVTYQFYLDSFDGIIDDLEKQLADYEYLKSGNFHYLNCKTLEDLPKIFISARIAQGMSQKTLGESLGISEQQVQRYEANDYDAVSYARLLDIGDALNLQLSFKEVIIIGHGPSFLLPEGIDGTTVDLVEASTQLCGSLIV